MKAKWLQTRPTDLADVHIWSRTENYKVLYSTRQKKGELNEDTSMEYKNNYTISNRDRNKAHNSEKGSECPGG